MKKLSDYSLNESNPRTITDGNLKKLIKSINELPQMMEVRPIVVDQDGIVLGGNMRFRALIEMGKTEVPDEWIKQISELTDTQKKEFIVKDNVGFGAWDWDILANEWNADELADWGLDLPSGWGDNQEAEDDGYEVPEKMQTDIVEGDLIEIGPHRILCGDSTNSDCWEKLMNGAKLDCINTDPPYNVDYTGRTKDALKIINDKMSQDDFYQFLYDFYVSIGIYTKLGAAWYIWHADSEGHNFRKALIDSGVKLAQCLIWVKNTMVMSRQDYHWQHEPCLYGWKEGAAHSWYSDRKQTTTMHFDKPQRNGEHPTMKPVELIAYQIKNSTKQGDIVGDGFLGSHTTMVASHQLGRICYGMELDPVYCQVGIDRMQKLDPTLQIKINGKEYGKK